MKLHTAVSNVKTKYPAWVATGDLVTQIFNDAKQWKYALPAVNVIGTHSANAALQAAKEVNAPIIVQVSNGGAHFFAWKRLPNDHHQAEIAWAISMAQHLRNIAELYGVTVILHSDHAARKLLGWVQWMIDADERYFEQFWEPLFSSHMIDLSEESLQENIQTSKKLMKRMSVIWLTTEVEIGITGGEEDWVDNTWVDNEKLYTQPSDVHYTYQELSEISDRFTIAAAFGNVHGVYKPGNVDLHPEILDASQKYVSKQLWLWDTKPVNFVFHGWSGSDPDKIKESLQYGVVKMNIDTDTQWAYCYGVRSFMVDNMDYLQTQIGNPDWPDMPNKKKYDPRVWQLEGERSMTHRLVQAFQDLNCVGRNKS